MTLDDLDMPEGVRADIEREYLEPMLHIRNYLIQTKPGAAAVVPDWLSDTVVGMDRPDLHALMPHLKRLWVRLIYLERPSSTRLSLYLDVHPALRARVLGLSRDLGAQLLVRLQTRSGHHARIAEQTTRALTATAAQLENKVREI